MNSIIFSKRLSIKCYVITILIFLAIGLWGTFLTPGDEMGYSILGFFIIMPSTTLITSLIISIKKGFLFWLYPVFAGALGTMIPFMAFHNFQVFVLLFTFFPAIIGVLYGLFIRRLEVNKGVIK